MLIKIEIKSEASIILWECDKKEINLTDSIA